MMNKRIICLGTILTYTSFAAGLEQLLTWSGENVGKANAVTSIVQGSEALYFNPAGLKSSGDLLNDISINASYLQSKLKSPITTANQSVDSEDGHHFIPAVFYSRKLDDKITLGVGVFPSAGLKIEYDAQPVSTGVTASPLTDVQMLEFSAGASYEITSKLSVGLAYRISYAQADFTTITPDVAAPGQGVAAKFTDMSDVDFLSFRGGVQYKEEKWGAGINVRTPITFKVEGESDVTGVAGSSHDDSASISTSLPLSVSLGGHYLPTENLTLLIDYTFINYKANDDLAIESDAPAGLGGSLSNKKLAWNDGHVLRLGAEYNLNSYLLRAGYIIVNSIVNPDYASPNVESPGFGHLFTLGGGIPVGENAVIDLAAFYGFGQDSVSSTSREPSGLKSTVDGDYKISGLGFHSSFGMKF